MPQKAAVEIYRGNDACDWNKLCPKLVAAEICQAHVAAEICQKKHARTLALLGPILVQNSFVSVKVARGHHVETE